jgi:hypothetical protein
MSGGDSDSSSAGSEGAARLPVLFVSQYFLA